MLSDRVRWVLRYAPVLQIGLAMALAAANVLAPRDADSPPRFSRNLREAIAIGPFLPERGLERLRAQMDLGGAAVVAQARRPGFEPVSYRPPGWRMFDLGNIPTLGLGVLTGDDARTVNGLIPNAGSIEPARPFVLPEPDSVSGRRALQCLTEAVYFETGRDDERSQAAIAQVVLNRMRHPAYPASVCGVVYQGAMRSTGCQFSFTCDGSLKRGHLQAAWDRAKAVATRALQGFVMPDVGTATNYHADYVAPYWARTVVRISRVGPHIFYRWTGPLGRSSAMTQRYDGNETNIAANVLASWDWRTDGVDAAVALKRAVKLDSESQSTVALHVLQSKGLVATIQDGQVHALLNPVQRKPTAEEIKAINDKLAEYEKSLNAPPPAQPAQTAEPQG